MAFPYANKAVILIAAGMATTSCTTSRMAPEATGGMSYQESVTQSYGLAAPTRLRLGSPTAVPRGYYNLCMSDKTVCKTSGPARTVPLTQESMAELRNVNRSINAAIRPQRDATGQDVWSIDSASGDCEDYALTKKQRLLQAGWPPSSLLIALVEIRGGGDHAVLIARTSGGDYVLDNRSEKVQLWSSTDYIWRMVQSPEKMWVWHAV